MSPTHFGTQDLSPGHPMYDGYELSMEEISAKPNSTREIAIRHLLARFSWDNLKKKLGNVWKKSTNSVPVTSSSLSITSSSYIEEAGKQCFVDNLPGAILFNIFSKMPFVSIFRMKLVCKRFAILLSQGPPPVYVSPAVLVTFTLESECRRIHYAVCDEERKLHFVMEGIHSCQVIAVGNGVVWAYWKKVGISVQRGWYVCNLTSSRNKSEIPMIEGMDLAQANSDFFALCFDPLSSFCMLVRAPKSPNKDLVDVFDFGLYQWAKVAIPSAAKAMARFCREENVFVNGNLFWLYKHVDLSIRVGVLRILDKSFIFTSLQLPANPHQHFESEHYVWLLGNCLGRLVVTFRNRDLTEDYWKFSIETWEWQYMGNSLSQFLPEGSLWDKIPHNGSYYAINKRNWIWRWCSAKSYGPWFTKFNDDKVFIEFRQLVQGLYFISYDDIQNMLERTLGGKVHQVKDVSQIMCYSNTWPAPMPHFLK